MFKNKLFILIAVGMGFLMYSCGSEKARNQEESPEEQVVNVYTHRHYDVDKQLFADFTTETGIKVNVVNASADELIQKMELEGDKSPADVLITVDAGRLHRAKEKGLIKAVKSTVLEDNIPSKFRDPEGHWFGVTYRARVIVYAPDRVNETDLSTYESLIDDKWKGKLLIRSSSNIYNQSLMASLIAANGEDGAKAWAEGMVKNMAREPKGSDRDQVKAIASGIGDIAVVNTYYIGKLLNSKVEEEVTAGKAVKVFFPNQGEGRGTHINVSGAAVAKHAPNEANAVKFIEYLSGDKAQSVFAGANYEYPVKPGVKVAELLDSWGTFKSDAINLSVLGENNQAAVMLFDEVGWK
ncbi:Fe(3+) ABC transporter substrate-binding protein [Fulvivirgaceae bacterium BMA12]|uniref:Fe(3+) ABC transporter substrate-binding protein n=1 Tax=Agaribacillus aureus TaxID=3051825 RepID=A0ABT8LEL7_9BACT|nr:Fe(3+) ABC transporter substrate-binding protein [Fulvivirgaceae bacterium BMA12]